MTRVRFATAIDLFETFPEVSKTIGVPPTDKPPLDFLRGLSAQGRLEDAVTFCAYLLPRREAVWWSCASVRALSGNAANKAAAWSPKLGCSSLKPTAGWPRSTSQRRATPTIPRPGWHLRRDGPADPLFPHSETPVPMPAA